MIVRSTTFERMAAELEAEARRNLLERFIPRMVSISDEGLPVCAMPTVHAVYSRLITRPSADHRDA